MLRILKEIMNEIYIEFDKKIEGRRSKEFDKDGITVYVHQFDEKMTITALKIDTQFQIDITAKKYSKLFDKYREIGEVSYKYTDRKVIIEFKEVSKIFMTPNGDKEIKENRIFGYCRVSSKGQLENNSLEQQEQEILKKYSNAFVVKEQFTGITAERPIFKEVVSKVSKGDVLVVTKLDRLARNTKEGIIIIEELFKKGVAVHVLNIGLLEDTTMGKFFLTTMLAVSEMERNMIIERTQAGKEIAKTKAGFKEGRPKKFKEVTLNHALSLLSINGGTMSYTEVVKATGISKSTLIRENNKAKIIKTKKNL
ncbi:MAG: recombinase family protein [Sarcina sp.]